MQKKSASGVPRLAEAASRDSRLAHRLTIRSGVRFASLFAAALLDELFAHPAWLFYVVPTSIFETVTEVNMNFSTTC